MADLSRRGFVATVAAAVPATSQRSRERRAAVPIPSGPLNPETLLALGEALLPTDLSHGGVSRIVAAFQAWLNAYTADAELLHGYGSGNIEHTPPNPTDRWNAQLAELETAAQRERGVAFNELSDAQRRRILTRVLNDFALERMPRPSRAHHVAVGLLAYFYATPEATDLCYRTNIAKNACRPLADSPKRPTARSQQRGRVRGP